MSRFGKFVRIFFDAKGGVAGAALTTYLLEKSRVMLANATSNATSTPSICCSPAAAEQEQGSDHSSPRPQYGAPPHHHYHQQQYHQQPPYQQQPRLQPPHSAAKFRTTRL